MTERREGGDESGREGEEPILHMAASGGWTWFRGREGGGREGMKVSGKARSAAGRVGGESVLHMAG